MMASRDGRWRGLGGGRGAGGRQGRRRCLGRRHHSKVTNKGTRGSCQGTALCGALLPARACWRRGRRGGGAGAAGRRAPGQARRGRRGQPPPPRGAQGGQAVTVRGHEGRCSRWHPRAAARPAWHPGRRRRWAAGRGRRQSRPNTVHRQHPRRPGCSADTNCYWFNLPPPRD